MEGMGGGSRGSRRGTRRWGRRQRRGDERRATLCLLFFGEGDEQKEDEGDLTSFSPILGDDMMDPYPEGGVGQGGGEWEDRGNRTADDEEETNTTHPSSPFSEKEMKEPWPPPLLYL